MFFYVMRNFGLKITDMKCLFAHDKYQLDTVSVIISNLRFSKSTNNKVIVMFKTLSHIHSTELALFIILLLHFYLNDSSTSYNMH